ncbi:MAG: hypothetical protein ACRDOE_10330, partial [Streptosporangiaceae bacterium]
MDTRFLLKIDPPQRCLGRDEHDQPCPRLSEYAEVDSPSSAEDAPRQLVVEPYCWQHLEMGIPSGETNPTPQALASEQFCITRFVVGYYGGTGTAEVCGPCPLKSVPPPYREASEADYPDEADKASFRWHHFEDQAYSVTYR